MARRVADRRRVQTGIDEDPLLGGLDHVRRDGEADLPVEVVVPAPDAGGCGEPPDVEHLDLHLSHVLRRRVVPGLLMDDLGRQ